MQDPESPPPEPVEVAAVINACVHDVVGPCPWCWDEHDLGLGPAHAFDPDLVLTILNRQAG